MKNASFLALCLLCLATSCQKDVKISDLPPSIQTWITANHPGFTADEAEKDVLCDGTNVFDVEAEKNEDEEMELTFDTSGVFLFSESEIAVDDLPTAVKTAISSKYPGASIKEADKLAMADGSTQYEVELKNGPFKEVVLGSEGNVICEAAGKP